MYYPIFNDHLELSHHYYSAKYFLPMDGNSKVVFLLSKNLKEVLEKNHKISPPYYLGDCSWSNPVNIKLRTVGEKTGLLSSLFKYRPTNILIWSNPDSKQITKFLLDRVQTYTVDRDTTWGCYQYPKLRYQLASGNKLKKQRANTHQKFISYIDSLPSLSKVYVFGTGPSIEIAFDFDFSDGYRIVCNTMIKNKELMNHIQPHFLVAADAIYHFGISKYASRFRKDLELFLNTHRCIFIAPEHYYANFIFHHSNLETLTVPVPYTADEINLSMKDKFKVKSLHNVLNQLLLPLASSLCDNIYLLGFDGRKQTDKHFWKSTDSVNYEGLKKYHQAAHPGFFKGIDYEEYAVMQSEIAELIISLGEKVGKKYYSLNESTNKALQKRYIGVGQE